MSDERLDIVNEHNELIGQALRSTVHQTGALHRGVHIFLFTTEGRLLVQQRSRAQDTFPGALDCSVSEHLRVAESYLDAALRGLKEELGIDPLHLTRLVYFRMDYGPGDKMINELYQGIIRPQTVTINHDEIEHIRYYTLSDMIKLLEFGEVEFSPWFAQLLRWYLGKPSDLDIIWENKLDR